jgi:hypothetical protein
MNDMAEGCVEQIFGFEKRAVAGYRVILTAMTTTPHEG